MIFDATINFNELKSLGLTHDELAKAILATLSAGVKHPSTGAPISLPKMHVTVHDDRTPLTLY